MRSSSFLVNFYEKTVTSAVIVPPSAMRAARIKHTTRVIFFCLRSDLRTFSSKSISLDVVFCLLDAIVFSSDFSDRINIYYFKESPSAMSIVTPDDGMLLR